MLMSIGEVMKNSFGDLETMMERAKRRIERHAENMREIHGEDFDIEKCWHCGGRGIVPGKKGEFCEKCDEGLMLIGADAYQRRWQLAIPERFWEYRFATHPNRDAAAEVLEWFQHGMNQGQNLYLGGPVGTGKTGLAIAALWAAHQGNRSILYRTVPDMLHELRPRDPNETNNPVTMTELQTTQLLLLDDLGAERAGAWPREQLYMVFNGRYQNGLPTIVTANHTPEKLEADDRVGQRVMSRFMESRKTIWMDGEDLRLRGGK